MVQCGVYAAETLCSSLGSLHCINLLVVGMLMRRLFTWTNIYFLTDGVMWIWYYDRQGCIQSEGFNFLEDLPTFLVLLYALQRLKLEQWGLNPSLDARVHKAHFGTLDRNYAREILEPNAMIVTIGGKKFELMRKVHHSTLGIIGRGTVAVEAKFQDAPDKRYAAKISWPEETRPNEAEVLQEAMNAARGDTDITNHIPTVFATENFPHCTANVHKALGIPERKDGHPDPRVLRVIVFPHLQPIVAFKERFLYSWLECVRCVCYQNCLMHTRL